jgi:hypothetical protein
VRATGDPLGWVSVGCTHASGATSSASMSCSAATAGRTEIEADCFHHREVRGVPAATSAPT